MRGRSRIACSVGAVAGLTQGESVSVSHTGGRSGRKRVGRRGRRDVGGPTRDRRHTLLHTRVVSSECRRTTGSPVQYEKCVSFDPQVRTTSTLSFSGGEVGRWGWTGAVGTGRAPNRVRRRRREHPSVRTKEKTKKGLLCRVQRSFDRFQVPRRTLTLPVPTATDSELVGHRVGGLRRLSGSLRTSRRSHSDLSPRREERADACE